MTKFQIYSLILCIIVFVMLVSVFSYMLTVMIKQTFKHIEAGLDDEKIIKEFGGGTKKESKFSKVVSRAIDVLICLIFGAIFISSLYVSCTQNVYFDNVPTYRVVLTSSMEEKNTKNTYLVENNLNNQIGAFDLIATYKIPKEEDLRLYDIVVYEVDGVLVVHRIVGIEEPNEKHPNERHFLLQGDSVSTPDRFPVLYSQMKGIYKGDKIPFIGSFVLFVQSPAGWLCMLLVFGAIIITPILESKLLKAKKRRYLLIGKQQEIVVTERAVEVCETVDEKTSSKFDNFRPTKTFYERLNLCSEQMKNRYSEVINTLQTIKNVRVIEAKTQHTYKNKSYGIARLFFRGKTLNVALALDPQDYKESKYVFTDLSETAKHKNYPMCLKLTSERQTRWACELVVDLAKSLGLKIMDKPVETVKASSPFDNLKRKKITFRKKLKQNPLAKQRFNSINEFISSIPKIRVVEGKFGITYKLKNVSVAKLTIKGKTLNVYLGLNPSEYKNTKYIFTDVSAVKKYQNYPMRIKATSDRQVKWIKELISIIVK